jgi:hypothetical protein
MDALLPKFLKMTQSMVQQSIRVDFPSIFEIVETENLKSLVPSQPVVFSILNLTGKSFRCVWIDLRGRELISNFEVISEKTYGSTVTFKTFTNHLFRLYFDAENLHSESIHFRIPLDKHSFYIGDIDQLEPRFTLYLNESSWINNPALTLNHLNQIEKLLNHNKIPLKYLETLFTRSTFYDDSEETRNVIDSFFKGFNPNNKFIDPFFNPLNLLDSKIVLKRISDEDIKKEKLLIPSENLRSKFVFHLINDTDTDFQAFWLDYDANPKSNFANFNLLSK